MHYSIYDEQIKLNGIFNISVANCRGPIELKADNAHEYSFKLYNTSGITPVHN
jgi:hypothetical protein